MANDPSAGGESCAFPTTAWDYVRAAQDSASPEHDAALNRLTARYWKPVFYFLRVHGYPPHQAEDLTQEFFTKFLERDWIARADQGRGRFRTFLLAILKRFLSDQGPKRAPRQQTFERRAVPLGGLLGDEERSFEPADHQTPDAEFMRRWAAELVGTVRQRLRQLCGQRERAEWYDIFEATHGDPPATQQALADRFGLSRDQVRYALEKTQEWFVVLLRGEVRQELGSDEDVGDEIRELLTLLGR